MIVQPALGYLASALILQSGAAGQEHPAQPALPGSLQSHQHVFVDSMKEHQWLSHFHNTNVSVYFLSIPCKETALPRSKSPRLPQTCLRGEMAAQLNGWKKRITFNYLPKKAGSITQVTQWARFWAGITAGLAPGGHQVTITRRCVAVNSHARSWVLQQELGIFQA